MEVVVPRAQRERPLVPLAPRSDVALAGPWGFVDSTKANADEFIEEVSLLLKAKGVSVGTVVRKMAPEAELSAAELSELSKSCTVIVECFGDCGASLSRAVLDTSRLEALGVPSAVVTSNALEGAGRALAADLGIPALPIVALPHHLASMTKVEIAKLAAYHLPAIEESLRAPAVPATSGDRANEWRERNWTLSDDPADAVREMEDLGWSDGLPGVPPVASAVQRMLTQAGLDAGALMPAVPPLGRESTAERWAANAVMAGARPESFPAIIAAVMAAMDPAAGLVDSQNATNASAPVVFFNGPVVAELSLRSEGNCFGSGFAANATIGRALRLILHNLGGEDALVNDLSTHGQPGKYSFCFAEREDASPFEPWQVSKGFAADESIVTVVMGNAPQSIFAYGCTSAEELLTYIAQNLATPGHMNTMFATGPLLVLSPDHARLLARDGLDRAAVQEALFERSKIPIASLPPNAQRALLSRRARWFETVGDHQFIGVADRPDDIHLVVAGGAGIHSCFITTSFSERPVLRRIAGA